MAVVVKSLPVNAGDITVKGSIPELGSSSGGGHGNSLRYSCLDRRAWRATVHRVAQSQTRLKQLSTHSCTKIKDTQEGQLPFRKTALRIRNQVQNSRT